MISELRDQLASDLAVLDVPVHVAWPNRVTVPCVALVPPSAASYVAPGSTFGTYSLGVDVLVLAGPPSAVTLEALDLLVEGVLRNTAGEWGLSAVDSPSTVTVNGSDVLGTIVHLVSETEL